MSKFFSLAYLTLPNTHPVDQIEIAAQCGYEGVGLADHLPAPARRTGLRPGQRPNVPDGPRCPGAHRREADGHRTGPGGGRGGRNELREGVRPGAELGAKYAIASVWSADRDFSRVQFEKMCDLADKYGMKLNLEFVPFSNIPGLTEALAWMDLMDRPNVQVLVDTLHAHR